MDIKNHMLIADNLKTNFWGSFKDIWFKQTVVSCLPTKAMVDERLLSYIELLNFIVCIVVLLYA